MIYVHRRHTDIFHKATMSLDGEAVLCECGVVFYETLNCRYSDKPFSQYRICRRCKKIPDFQRPASAAEKALSLEESDSEVPEEVRRLLE